jgi:threonyl-tRNA synthetase
MSDLAQPTDALPAGGAADHPSDHPSPAENPHDHRRLGRELDIFTTDELAGVGFPIWLPAGAAIVAELERYILEVEHRSGYQHVRTPPVAKRELYERSGHWQHFGPDMFPPMPLGRPQDAHDAGPRPAGDELVLRPVLCPHHALVFRSRLRSHRELPLRIGEVGPQFRMERSGVVSGLTRVRGMILNDAHVFCSLDRAAEEVAAVLQMIDQAYDVLGIKAAYYSLSLRGPAEAGKSYAGSEQMWQRAEAVLRDALDRYGVDYREQAGEAAFYGPKIDVQVHDAQGREFTLSTAQVDLYQPDQFDLTYVGPDGSRQRPVIVHRSVLASMERMVAYLLEAYAGALPAWLSPLQVMVLPIGPDERDAARKVRRLCAETGLRADVDERDESLGARIRAAQLRKVPFVAIVGPREAAADAVAVRLRDGRRAGPVALDRFVDGVRHVVESRRSNLALPE